MNRIKVVQVYRVERVIYMDVDAPDMESAIELVSSGDTDLPEWSDERWQEGWELLNEEVGVS